MDARVPVIVHRWFRNGDGWSYHPTLEKEFAGILMALSSILKPAAPMGEFEIPFRKGKLVGHKSEDRECLDPKAQKRNPFILKAAYLDQEQKHQIDPEAVQTELEKLTLPDTQGRNGKLHVHVLTQPETKSPRQAPVVAPHVSYPYPSEPVPQKDDNVLMAQYLRARMGLKLTTILITLLAVYVFVLDSLEEGPARYGVITTILSGIVCLNFLYFLNGAKAIRENWESFLGGAGNKDDV